MKIKLMHNCPGRSQCEVFSSPDQLLDFLGEKVTFRKLMLAMSVIKSWVQMSSCPFRIQSCDEDDGEFFHNPICSLKSSPPFSMEAVSRGTGYSKTRVAQIEYSAIRKVRKHLVKAASGMLMSEFSIDTTEVSNICKSRR